METRRRSHDKGENLVYIFSTMRERGWFPELDRSLKAELAEALFVVGRDKLHFDRAQEARSYFWRCFCLGFRLKALAGAIVTCLPCSVRTMLKAILNILRRSKELNRSKTERNPIGNFPPVR